MRELILGGARSGKSAWAERRAAQGGLSVVYVATAQARDEEMHERIRRHRAQRPSHWALLEQPLALADSLLELADDNRCVLVDCLTVWLSNLLEAGDRVLEEQRDALLACLDRLPGHIILVSNEVGQGIVPTNPLARRFVDEAGRLHQQLAARCERVTLVVAGLPQILKEE
ncbi:bifunctional adenosylcobinamide kinase/adenosylcobinamide-phosphate guanylyltransferase [Alkalilimnicola sp. S0819]|uniref:bifunctional adenosylcobinamide kinase/adenosylcobinamide-phosphate guanylyltransferase n=1 Tax=Alkalilimnicola sp. S0819 TaxID=2613922 RepID=UPI0012627EB2|nr:bifunctional adenosylcobinamide kinase/adenosylcobinamide-phosphate guanylyltransferase [Alkalilimnicola sp. S0819]KAB7623368.1 bifunctional adenosylcobinamide kinase/adenosylcobinamide-phosphate guanylyltransferase [Alkalilimnicola sp. S0819]MPQ16908.1 bifunctional adenosylcobinamide kinase/adenosylcobinamide-phosphate guanylyltransferase [Alkalilimnicola sp. S0819]